MKKRMISLFTSLLMVLSLVVVMPADLEVSAASPTIETALQWAINIANDNSHGYSQANRWGPDYDCSSFVISALKSAGLDVGGATYTGNMKSNLTKHGFTWIPWDQISSSANLKRGDILLNESSHTEFYLGNNQNVGAHSNRGYPQAGDQTGTEVSVSGYYYHPWDGVLRYQNKPIILPGTKANLGTDFSAKIRHVSSDKYLTDNSTDVALFADDKTRLSAQIWKFHRNSDGSYTIKSSYNNKVFDLDNYNDIDGTNIHLWENGGTSNQKWYIYKLDDGSFALQPTCSKTRVLDLANGSTTDGTTAWLYTYNGTEAQKFDIFNCGEIVNLGDDVKGFIMNKPSWKPIMQTDSSTVVLGTEKAVNMKRSLWHMFRNDDGSYTIYSYLNNKIMAVKGGKDADNTRIVCLDQSSWGTNGARWWFLRRFDGSIYLKSACSTRDLDLLDGKTDDGTPLQMYPMNNTNAQIFEFYALDSSRDKISYTIKAAKTNTVLNEKVNVTISNCNYTISYKIHVIDPSGKETIIDNGCNNIYSFSGTKVGKYIIFAEVTSPVSSDKGSKTNKYVTINVSCAHKYGSWTTTKSATCTTAGSKTRTCSLCGNKETASIAATGHTAVTDKAVAATCTTAGKTEGSHCSVCGTVIKAQTTVPATGHSYDSGKITKSATCTTAGTKTYICSECGGTKTETIAATGHTAVTDQAVAATCTTAGKTEGSHCSVCGTVIKAQTTVPATGHTYVDTLVDPTYAAQGYTLHKCSVCGASYKDTYTAKKTVPDAKISQTYTSTGTSFTLNWGKVAGATGYKIYKYDGANSKWVLVKTVSGANTLSTTVSGFTPGSVIKFKVNAYAVENGTTYYGKTNDSLNAAAIGNAKISQTYSSTGTGFTLNWGKVAGATGYKVYKYDGANSKWVLVKTVSGANTLSTTVSGFTPGSVIKFKVIAYLTKGTKTYYGKTNDFLYAAAIGNASFNKNYESTRTYAEVNWNKVAGATGYKIYKYDSANKKWAIVKTVTGADTTSTTVTGLTSGTTTKLKVNAYLTKNGTTYVGKAGTMLDVKTKS